MKAIMQKALLAAAIFALAAGSTVFAEEASQTNPHPGALLRSSKAVGAKVFTTKGEQMGTIDDVLFDPKTGQVSYAVLGIGGFLGIGEKKTLVPWDKIREDVKAPENFIVEVDQQKLKGAPSFEGNHWAEATQPDYLKTVQDYYAKADQSLSPAEKQEQAKQAAEREAERRQQQAAQQKKESEKAQEGEKVQTPTE